MRVRVDKVYSRCTHMCTHGGLRVYMCVIWEVGRDRRWMVGGSISYPIQLGKIN